ncbi:MAG: heavy-metal-associated domain-containing protein [Solobacterium sp.]|nr:heavy-metal-associated domain-containing protein [Solobacterium sp.]MBQ1446935.1 heavy-metal-associated domain-containing protein [Solobacterium sp.]MBQ6591480.1 heavy-metal-associated domain-containing protein [Solobacterium sp.]MBR2727375.1 heavy-metal-associated domain-containing protein [Solobacterium sp.]
MIRTVVKVDGMMCSMCETHINEAVRKQFDVKKVKSNRRKKETVIESAEPLDREKLKKTIEDTGYIFLGFEE